MLFFRFNVVQLVLTVPDYSVHNSAYLGLKVRESLVSTEYGLVYGSHLQVFKMNHRGISIMVLKPPAPQ